MLGVYRCVGECGGHGEDRRQSVIPLSLTTLFLKRGLSPGPAAGQLGGILLPPFLWHRSYNHTPPCLAFLHWCWD